MKFDSRDLIILNAIENQGTFAKAAEHLGRTPSAVTQHIKKLEDLLGFQIFDRTKYRLKMTKEGRLFMERGQQILKQMDRLENDLQLIQKGWESEFSIAYDDVISYEKIFPLILEFQKIAPSVSIRLYREVLNGCWDALAQNRATLAIGASGEPPVGLSCSQKTLGEIDFVFAVAPHHPLAKCPDPISNNDISMHYSIVISDTSQRLPTRNSGILSGQPIICVPDMLAKINAQVQGVGVGYLPLHRIEHLLKSGALIERSVDSLKSKSYLKLAWRTDNNSKILEWFLAQLDLESIKKNLLSPN